MKTELIGVDLGGTKFEAGSIGVEDSGLTQTTLLSKHRTGVHPDLSSIELIDRLLDCIRAVWSPQTKGIGIGVPGLVDAKEGEILDIQNLPAWKKIKLKQIVREEFQVDVSLNNDVNCFALGSYFHGVGRNFQNMVMVSLGTGLGCGIIVRGKLLDGLLCGAGEIGMIPYLDGIVETYCGSFFFQNQYQQDAKTMHEQAQKGDKTSLRAFDEYGQHLAEAIRIILFAYAPEAIILGGSIAHAMPFFNKSLLEALADYPYSLQLKKTQIIKEDTPDLPLIGSAMLAY